MSELPPSEPPPGAKRDPQPERRPERGPEPRPDRGPERGPEKPVHFATDRETLEREVELSFVRGSGPGGQHRNKVETGVRLHHAKSGITIVATSERSQHRNREQAFERLIEKLRARNHRPKKRKPTRKPRSADRRRLEAKKRNADRKRGRKPPAD